MNVGEIVQRVYDRLGHDPNLAQYRSSVIRRLNDGYEPVNDSALWLFLQKVVDLQIRATVAGTDVPLVPATISAAVNRRLVTVAAVAAARSPNASWEGQVFETTGASADDVQYTIGRVISTTQFYLTTPYSNVPPINIDPNWRVTFPRYPVPRDCSEVLGITSRADDEGRLLFVDRKKEELAYLDRDDTGEPRISVEDDWYNDVPPARAPTLANTATIGGLLANNVYEYRYTFFYEGRESPPSPTANLTTDAGPNVAVGLSDLQDTRWNEAALLLETRRDKWIYRRDVTNSGPWQRVGSVTTAGDTTFTDVSLNPAQEPTITPYGDVPGLVPLLEAGPREHLRLWYTPATDKLLSVRYHRRPPKLAADADVPVWPVPYHRALVDLTMADILRTHGLGDDADRCEKRAGKLIEQMAKRYLTRTDRPYRFGRWDQHLVRARYRNYGAPTIT